MATVRVKYRQSAKADQEGTIYYQVLHRRVARQINTGIRIKDQEWDARRSEVRSVGKGKTRSAGHIRERIRCDIDRLRRIIRKMDAGPQDYTADDIVEEFRSFSECYSFGNYTERVITRFRQNGRDGTAKNYRSALNSFRKFIAYLSTQGHEIPEEDVMLDNFTSELMESYEAWHRRQGHTSNTVSFYTRIFRAVYTRAVEDNIIEDTHLFRRVYTGVDKTEKRAMSLETIREMKGLDLHLAPKLDYARDIFLLSYYLRGMSFVDMCFLKKTDLKHGMVTYRRRKTGQQLTIGWTEEMQMILDKYPENETEYLLPIITNPNINPNWAYRNMSYRINRSLKEIGEKLGAQDASSWTLYKARHSWASLARANGIPVSVISEAMGHANERTTQIYLASLETSVVDKANAVLISLLN